MLNQAEMRRLVDMQHRSYLLLKWMAKAVSEDLSLLAYGYDMSQREKGIANGPAVLALWRGFAWNELGSPKHGFRLKADMIIDAQNRLLDLLGQPGENGNVGDVAEPSDEPKR